VDAAHRRGRRLSRNVGAHPREARPRERSGECGDLERDRQTCRAQAVAMSPLVWDQRSQQMQVDDLDVMQRTTTCMMISGWELTPRK